MTLSEEFARTSDHHQFCSFRFRVGKQCSFPDDRVADLAKEPEISHRDDALVRPLATRFFFDWDPAQSITVFFRGTVKLLNNLL